MSELGWNDVVAQLHSWLGRRVMVSIAPIDDRGPLGSVTGTLSRGEESPSQALLEALGKVRPGDEALVFSIEPEMKLTLDAGRFVAAGHAMAGSIWVQQAGVVVTVGDEEALLAEAGRLGILKPEN